ncbi:DUF6273 domain-containing protein [Pseudobutyrivibrio sp.]|uniref:DUF6273 domain-containing protein n=1 Tax=Pseudobutyrivibrio sp. TaxID=2014367 RepID=UPI001DE931C3|nr:DUF6273 domain-containing protein [Pseudobutyrivibrio sp.]MBE5910689.1 hypothetical protein [Pseudobutyrivibrio sp.]
MRKTINRLKRILTLTLVIFMGTALIGVSLNADAKKKASSSTYAEGDDIAFGTLDNTIINWTILTYDDTTKIAFVVARKTLTSNSITSYKQAIINSYLQSGTSAGYVQWADSYWRGWLNQVFYYNSFTEAERAMIQQTPLTTADAQKSIMNFYHDTTLDSYYVANGVKNSLNMNIYNNQTPTNDYIFFLSSDEFTDNLDKIKFETTAQWPLRTNSYDDPAKGLYVNDTTKLVDRQFFYMGTGIRPAMYIQLGEPEATTDSSTDSTSTTATTTDTASTKSTADTTTTNSTSDTTTTASTTTSTAATTSTTQKASGGSSRSYANNATNIGNINLPDDASYELSSGSSAQVALNTDYLNSTDKEYNVTYTSSNASVFTVDSNGVITSAGKGTATLTVRMKKSNGKVYTMTCRIDVT